LTLYAIPPQELLVDAQTRTMLGAADFDLELIESRTLDGRTHELIFRPTLHN
jgi:hypothetical protein